MLLREWIGGGDRLEAEEDVEFFRRAGLELPPGWPAWPGPTATTSTSCPMSMLARGIIDPLKVTRSALENAVSIAGMVLTTNCLVTDIPDKAGAGMAAPPMY